MKRASPATLRIADALMHIDFQNEEFQFEISDSESNIKLDRSISNVQTGS
jgi:hypothetical protein